MLRAAKNKNRHAGMQGGVHEGGGKVLESWREEGASAQRGGPPTGNAEVLVGGELLLGGRAGRWPGTEYEIPKRVTGEGVEVVMAPQHGMLRPGEVRRASGQPRRVLEAGQAESGGEGDGKSSITPVLGGGGGLEGSGEGAVRSDSRRVRRLSVLG